jgi:hypothetical protein
MPSRSAPSLRGFRNELSRSCRQYRVITVPLAAPMIAIGRGESLCDKSTFRIGVADRRIAMAVTCRRRDGGVIFCPIYAVGAGWSERMHFKFTYNLRIRWAQTRKVTGIAYESLKPRKKFAANVTKLPELLGTKP